MDVAPQNYEITNLLLLHKNNYFSRKMSYDDIYC